MKSIACILMNLFLLFAAKDTPAQTLTVTKPEMIQLFEKINGWFRLTPSYSMTVTHTSYENYKTDVPSDRFVGYFKKEKENYHSFLVGIHTVQNNNYKFVIDSSEKRILVANTDQLAWISYTPDDYMAMLKYSTALKVSNKGNDKLYRMELPENYSIGAYEFLVDAAGMLKEITWYYNRQVEKNTGDATSKVKPRMSITFSAYKKDIAFNYKDIFGDEPYFQKKGNKLVTTDKYKNYKLIDQRLRN